MTLGEPFTIRWKVLMYGNAAEQPYYHIQVEVFLHRHHDEDVVRMYATQEWLEAHEQFGPRAAMNKIRKGSNNFGAESAGYVRSYLDGTVVDPLDVYSHPLID